MRGASLSVLLLFSACMGEPEPVSEPAPSFTKTLSLAEQDALTASSCSDEDEYADALPVEVDAVPISSGRESAYGRLSLRGVVELTSGLPEFGGISGIDVRVLDGGDVFAYAVSDQGSLFTFVIDEPAAGGLDSISQVSLYPLRDKNGTPLSGKTNADAESIAVDDFARLAISFERDHRIEYLNLVECGANSRLIPSGQVDLGDMQIPDNSGLEAMAVEGEGLDMDNYTILVALEHRIDGRTPVGAGPYYRDISFKDAQSDGVNGIPVPADFGTTALDVLTGEGRAFSLQRAWDRQRGNRIRIIELELAETGGWRRGAEQAASMTILAELDKQNFPVDNFEGLSVRRVDDQTVRLYLISDDNFSERQRTLLVAFDYTIPAE